MPIIIVAHNIRSTYNVGSVLRTADGFGVYKVFLTGYTPYPVQPRDQRLPHIREKLTKQIHKTALGAETTMATEHAADPTPVIKALRQDGYHIAALEQAPHAILLPDYTRPANLALLLGEEVKGVDPHLLSLCDTVLEIPMHGHKESFNVSVAAGIALYELSKTM
jgi:23S rRNA (guanosine2251-2'-O)-methyltransferase